MTFHTGLAVLLILASAALLASASDNVTVTAPSGTSAHTTGTVSARVATVNTNSTVQDTTTGPTHSTTVSSSSTGTKTTVASISLSTPSTSVRATSLSSSSAVTTSEPRNSSIDGPTSTAHDQSTSAPPKALSATVRSSTSPITTSSPGSSEECQCNKPLVTISASQLNLTVAQLDISEVPKVQFRPWISTDDECCGGESRLTYKDHVINETTASRTIRRVWTVTDACDQRAMACQILKIILVVNEYSKPPRKVRLDQCSQAYNLTRTGTPQLIKGDGTAVESVYTDVITRTWKIYDGSGDVKTFVQTIHCGQKRRSCECARRTRCRKPCEA